MYKEDAAGEQLEERKQYDLVIHSVMYCSSDSINDDKSDKETEMKIIGCVWMVKRSRWIQWRGVADDKREAEDC